MDNNFSQEQINFIIQQYNNDIPVIQIVEELNTNEHCVREILKEYQIDRQYNNWKPELTQRVIELHQNGMLHKDIRYALLVSDQGINKTIDRNGIPRMSYTERNRHYDRNSNYFDVIDTANKAYFFGLLCSDGSNSIGHRQIIISLQEEDGYLLEKLKEELEYTGEIKICDRNHQLNPKHKITHRFAMQDIHMSEQLEQMGMVARKSYNFKFPTCVPDEFMRDFLRGYFDGDGCVGYYERYKKGNSSLVGTHDFCINVQKILAERDIKSCIVHPKQCKDSDTYVLMTSATNATYHFLSWLYDDAEIKMIRKYEKYLIVRERYFEIHAA